MGQAVFGFLSSFLLTPFGALGYIFVAFILFYEVIYELMCSSPVCYYDRVLVILVTIIGRLVGEILWGLVLSIDFRIPGLLHPRNSVLIKQ